MLDDRRRKAMSLEGDRNHSVTVATSDRLGQTLNVSMPLGVFDPGKTVQETVQSRPEYLHIFLHIFFTYKKYLFVIK